MASLTRAFALRTASELRRIKTLRLLEEQGYYVFSASIPHLDHHPDLSTPALTDG